jgi:PIN domain nuclease of toxin-antitoxin system
VRYLLDTQTLLWYTLANPKLSGPAKALVLDSSNEILVSIASFWEIAIKASIGKLTLHQPFEKFVDVCLNKYAFTALQIEPKHAAAVMMLPFHHRDPFDRLLVAQAIVESIPIVSSDAVLDQYPVTRLW